uniref:hypothetical protein n=1 Tax=Gluconobacter thailandicus TaxID=257438 RepID=UPI0012E74BA0|nr:hypothetical protein [Gluconobacter thailandicus]
MRAEGHGCESHGRIGGLAHDPNVLGNVGWRAGAVEPCEDDAMPTQDVGFVKRVGVSNKGWQAARGLKGADINALMQELPHIAFERFGQLHIVV